MVYEKLVSNSSSYESGFITLVNDEVTLCVCISGRQPFPAGDRVTFNGKECICEKCTQPVPVNSTAPPQAVYSKFSVFLHC